MTEKKSVAKFPGGREVCGGRVSIGLKTGMAYDVELLDSDAVGCLTKLPGGQTVFWPWSSIAGISIYSPPARKSHRK